MKKKKKKKALSRNDEFWAGEKHFLPLWPEGEKCRERQNAVTDLGKEEYYLNFCFYWQFYLQGQQPVWGKKLYCRTIQMCNGERKSGRALKGTEAKFKTISFYKRKICYWALIELLPGKGHCSLSIYHPQNMRGWSLSNLVQSCMRKGWSRY